MYTFQKATIFTESILCLNNAYYIPRNGSISIIRRYLPLVAWCAYDSPLLQDEIIINTPLLKNIFDGSCSGQGTITYIRTIHQFTNVFGPIKLRHVLQGTAFGSIF